MDSISFLIHREHKNQSLLTSNARRCEVNPRAGKYLSTRDHESPKTTCGPTTTQLSQKRHLTTVSSIGNASIQKHAPHLLPKPNEYSPYIRRHLLVNPTSGQGLSVVESTHLDQMSFVDLSGTIKSPGWKTPNEAIIKGDPIINTPVPQRCPPPVLAMRSSIEILFRTPSQLKSYVRPSAKTKLDSLCFPLLNTPGASASPFSLDDFKMEAILDVSDPSLGSPSFST